MASNLSTDEVKLLLRVMSKIKFFSSIPMKDIDKIIEHFTLQIHSGKKILKQGQEDVGLFIIKSGSCQVYREKWLFSKDVLATLGTGDFFGEMSLIYDRPVGATVAATEKTELYFIEKSIFMNILKQTPEVLKKVCEIAESREK